MTVQFKNSHRWPNGWSNQCLSAQPLIGLALRSPVVLHLQSNFRKHERSRLELPVRKGNVAKKGNYDMHIQHNFNSHTDISQRVPPPPLPYGLIARGLVVRVLHTASTPSWYGCGMSLCSSVPKMSIHNLLNTSKFTIFY